MSQEPQGHYSEIYLVVWIVTVLACFGIGCAHGCDSGREMVKEEAVREGHAEYVPDEGGKPKWRWKDLPPKPPLKE